MHHDIPMEGNSFLEVKFLLGTGNSSAEDTWVQHEEVMLLVASALSPIWECHLSKQTWTKEYVTGDIQLRLHKGLSGVLVTLKRTNHLQLGSYMNSGKTSQRVDYHIPGYQQGWGPSEECLEDPTFS